MPTSDPPDLSPDFVLLLARTIQRGHRFLSFLVFMYCNAGNNPSRGIVGASRTSGDVCSTATDPQDPSAEFLSRPKLERIVTLDAQANSQLTPTIYDGCRSNSQVTHRCCRSKQIGH
jgi:hypothetical protein